MQNDKLPFNVETTQLGAYCRPSFFSVMDFYTVSHMSCMVAKRSN